MTTSTTSVNLTPTGIGSDYGSRLHVLHWFQVMAFTRSGDTLTLTRARKGTTARCINRETQQLIISGSQIKTKYRLRLAKNNYAFAHPAFIDKSAWDAEQVGYLPRLYNTLIPHRQV